MRHVEELLTLQAAQALVLAAVLAVLVTLYLKVFGRREESA